MSVYDTAKGMSRAYISSPEAWQTGWYECEVSKANQRQLGNWALLGAK
jgi:hypothetical protein